MVFLSADNALLPARPLRARPLTAAEFAPFGRVVAGGDGAGRPVNAGTAMRFDPDAGLGHRTAASLPRLGIYRCQPQDVPARVPLLERHPHSSQTFLPLTAPRYLVVVAPAGPLRSDHARAFLAGAAQAITYAPGIWHSPMIALDRESDFAMLMWETGRDDDTDVEDLALPLIVSL